MCNRGVAENRRKPQKKRGRQRRRSERKRAGEITPATSNTVGAAFTAYIFRLMPERMQNK